MIKRKNNPDNIQLQNTIYDFEKELATLLLKYKKQHSNKHLLKECMNVLCTECNVVMHTTGKGIDRKLTGITVKDKTGNDSYYPITTFLISIGYAFTD